MKNKNYNNNFVINDFFTDFEEHKFIFDNLDDVILSMSWPELKLNFISKAIEDIVGYSVKAFKNDPLLLKKITHSDDKKTKKKVLENLEHKGFSEREFRITNKNGNVQWVYEKTKIIYDEDNNPIRVEGIIKDITERKETEKKIKYKEKVYRTIFNSAPNAIMLEDKEGKVIDVNDAMCEVSGYTKKELIGRSVVEKFVLPEYKDLAKENIKRLINGEDLEFDIRTSTKTGEIKYYHLKETSITFPDGSMGIISMHLNITERKKMENSLRENNNLLNSILESIQDGIAVLNTDFTIRYANSTMKKWFNSKSKLKDKKCFHEFYEKKNKCQDCPVKKSLKSAKIESSIKKISSDNEIDFFEIFSYPIYDQEKNEITGIVEYVRNITDSLKQKRELELMDFSINKAELLIFRVNSDGIIEYANETALKQLAYKKEQLIGLNAKKIISNNQQIDRESYWEKLKSNKSLNYELNYLTKKDKSYPVEITSQYFKYQNKEYEFVFAQDITERLEKEKEIKYLAYRDSLTDLYNRRFFEAEMDKLDTEKQLPISIIMGDLNGLKIINDSYGQKIGDQLLIKTAEMLKEVVREDDVLARYGGDEFTILLPQTTNETAEELVEQIKYKSKDKKINEISISISMGTATKLKKDKKIKETIKEAEDNMNQNKLSERKSSKNKIIQGLLNTLNAKSSETKEHALRMTKLALDFGEKLGLSISEINRLSLLATLHDIGKTSIPESILKKPGKLTKKEWRLMNEHPQRGYKIAAATEEFSLVADEILTHHEKWDGSGYPNGLKGEEIPYLARIITIVDSYDVMTNDRPYSKAMPQKEALAEIEKCAGSQFDPELAEVFIEMTKN